jgi:hypothetical protein
MAMSEERDAILQFFEFDHLPPDVRQVAMHFHALAHNVVQLCRRNPERSVALRKLVEAKDAAIRALLYK